MSDRVQTLNPALKAGKIFLILLVAINFLACTNTPSNPPSLANKIATLAPSGWEMDDSVQIFTAQNLYQHINGRAELYLSYDVNNLTTVTFEKKSDIGEFIELSIYDMNTTTNAFGIFSVERSLGEIYLDLGRESYRSGSSIFIWQDRFYTTIVTSDISDKLLPLSLELAQKAMALLPDSNEPIWGLSALPPKNLIPDSVKYFKVDALGLDFMQNTYTAEYRKDKIEIMVFLSQQDSPDSARNSIARYSEYAERYGLGSRSITKDSVEYVLCDMNGSFDVIFQKGSLVGGVQSVAKESMALEAAAELWAQISD